MWALRNVIDKMFSITSNWIENWLTMLFTRLWQLISLLGMHQIVNLPDNPVAFLPDTRYLAKSAVKNKLHTSDLGLGQISGMPDFAFCRISGIFLPDFSDIRHIRHMPDFSDIRLYMNSFKETYYQITILVKLMNNIVFWT